MSSIGIILGLAAALSVTTHNRQIRNLTHVNAMLINWLKFTAVVVTSAALITLTDLGEWTLPSWQFFAMVALAIPIERTIAHLGTRALQESDQSLMAPLHGLTPIFLIPLGLIFLAEVPSLLGLFGIGLILIGTVYLGLGKAKKEIGAALRALWKERGTKYMVGSTFFAASAFIVAKFAFTYGSPVQYVFYIYAVNASVSALLVVTRFEMSAIVETLRGKLRPLSLAACSFGITPLLHFTGLSYMPTSYFSAIKRSSILFDVIVGATIGKEEEAAKRLLAGVLVLMGIILFVFA